MSTPSHEIWNLEVYDQQGNVVASGYQKPNEAPTIKGDMVHLAEALPAVISLGRFFTDPDAKARAAYTAYAEAWENTYGSSLPTWDELKAMPQKASTLAIWRKVGEASAAASPDLN